MIVPDVLGRIVDARHREITACIASAYAELNCAVFPLTPRSLMPQPSRYEPPDATYGAPSPVFAGTPVTLLRTFAQLPRSMPDVVSRDPLTAKFANDVWSTFRRFRNMPSARPFCCRVPNVY